MATNSDKKSVKASATKAAAATKVKPAAKKPVAKTVAKPAAKTSAKPVTAVENTVIITYDGVRYEISQAENERMKAFMADLVSRARVVKDDKAPQVKTVAEPVVAKKESAPREQRPDDVVKGLIGHTNVVYYNWKTNKWNTGKYNGYVIRDRDLGMLKKFKAEMENIPEFGLHYEFLTPVIMTTEWKWFAESLSPRPGVQYLENGNNAVGNIIVRDKATGMLELYCWAWLHLGSGMDWSSIYSTWWFVEEGALCASSRNKMIEAHTR